MRVWDSHLLRRSIASGLRVAFFLVLVTRGVSSGAAHYQGFDLYTIPELNGWSFAGPLYYQDDPYAVAAGGHVVNSGLTKNEHALRSNSPSGTLLDLHPTNLSGFEFSQAHATDGQHQVGYGYGSGTGGVRALLWSGTSNSAVDLTPTLLPSFFGAEAMGVSGNQQVGVGLRFGIEPHALLWNGTAESAVDLNPTHLPGVMASVAYGTDGQHQVGSSGPHALLWNGTAASAIDLHPAGFFERSAAVDVSGNQQVGYGCVIACGIGTDRTHALIWHGTASSAVDLNPAGIFNSKALGTNGSWQVGWGQDGDYRFHGLAWQGSANSVVDLGSLLSLPHSYAFSIDANNTIYGVAFDADFNVHAVEWRLVPEPDAACLLLFGIVCLVCTWRQPADRFFSACQP